jgi:hypothetical protein
MTEKEILQLIALVGVYDARKVPNDQIRLAAMAGEWAYQLNEYSGAEAVKAFREMSRLMDPACPSLWDIKKRCDDNRAHAARLASGPRSLGTGDQ